MKSFIASFLGTFIAVLVVHALGITNNFLLFLFVFGIVFVVSILVSCVYYYIRPEDLTPKVRLTEDVPDFHLKAGQIGTIISQNTNECIVEFELNCSFSYYPIDPKKLRRI